MGEKSRERGKPVQVIATIDHGVARTFNALTIISVVAELTVIIVCVLDVVGGKLFNHPFAPAYELTQMFSIPLVFFGVGSVQMGRGLLRIDMLEKRFPPAIQRAIGVIYGFGGVVVCAFLAWRSWVYTTTILFAGHVKTTGNVKMAEWPYGVILTIGLSMLAVSFVFTGLRFVFQYEVIPDLSPEELLELAKKKVRKKDPDAVLEESSSDQDVSLEADPPLMQGSESEDEAMVETVKEEKGGEKNDG